MMPVPSVTVCNISHALGILAISLLEKPHTFKFYKYAKYYNEAYLNVPLLQQRDRTFGRKEVSPSSPLCQG